MQEDVFDLGSASSGCDYEKISYGKWVYRRVQRLRRKGKRRAIEVPQLGYKLTKPDKPRIAFWILAIISAIFLIGIVVGIGFLYNELVKTFSLFGNLGDVLKVAFDPKTFALSAGLSSIPAIMVILAYLLVVVMLLLPIAAIIYVYNFVREIFYMANCSKEEFARGNVIASRISGLVVALITSTVIFIALLIYFPASARILLGLVYGAIVIVCGGLLALIVVERAKNRKWFETLDEDKKQNFLAHDNALRKVKSRLRFERNLWNDFGR